MRTSIEAARGCGYRKEGGLYLVADRPNEPCERLPLAVEACPHCGQGIKPARGWTWVKPATLFPAQTHGSVEHNATCPLGLNPILDGGEWRDVISTSYHRTGDRAGLIWIGEVFYPTPESFMREAVEQGISRRIVAVPRGFEVGTTWVYLGHRRAISHGSEEATPGVMTLFKPTAIEYIVRPGEENDEALMESLDERGITPVKVVRADVTEALDLDDSDEDSGEDEE